MIRSVTIYRKTGDTSWDYFIDPNTVPADNQVCEIWKTAQSHLYGAESKALFPGLNFNFTVVSTNELHMNLTAEDSELDAVIAWLSNATAIDIHHASGFHNLCELLYPGETFTEDFEILEVPTNIWNNPAANQLYAWLKAEPTINVIEN